MCGANSCCILAATLNIHIGLHGKGVITQVIDTGHDMQQAGIRYTGCSTPASQICHGSEWTGVISTILRNYGYLAIQGASVGM